MPTVLYTKVDARCDQHTTAKCQTQVDNTYNDRHAMAKFFQVPTLWREFEIKFQSEVPSFSINKFGRYRSNSVHMKSDKKGQAKADRLDGRSQKTRWPLSPSSKNQEKH